MFRNWVSIGLIAGLAACGGGTGNNPINGGGGGGDGETTQNDIPEELARNLQRINYNADTDTLIVEISSLDSGDGEATYDRNPALDVPGYSAFTLQDDPLDRMFIALVAASTDGSVQAGVVGDGGQFNRYFSGGFYERTGPYSQPTTGQVSYAGAYAGITNLPAAGDNLLDPPPGTDPSLLPREPRITVGTAFLNVSFGDNSVNGAIFDRSFVDDGSTLPDVALIETELDSNGEFLGTVEFSGRPDEGEIGSFGGILGGEGATSVAGVIYLDSIYVSDDPRNSGFENEVGVFVLPQCGTPGAPSICDDLN